MASRTDTLVTFSRRLESLQEKRNLTHAEIAAVAKVSRSAVYKWLSGTTPPGSLELFRLASYFGVPMEWLLGVGATAKETEQLIESRLKAQAVQTDQKYEKLRAAVEELLKKF